ncbi:hypothetical protein AWT69_004497 [Pseudomonas putida]|nr:hypothetical protein AWT69_004497 [Pseudomonas putida]
MKRRGHQACRYRCEDAAVYPIVGKAAHSDGCMRATDAEEIL